jgi:hypothetical protein
MGFLENFERSVERVVGGSFAKAFASGVHPGEIVAGLKREIDARAKVMSRTRVLAPHEYVIALAPADHERLTGLGDSLVEEISQALREYATLRGYSFSKKPALRLRASPDLSEGMLDIRSEPPGAVLWIPTLMWETIRYPLIARSTIIGRGTDSDIHVVAPGVSRHHCEIRWNGKRAEVVDLGSTNGTQLDGAPITRAALPDACTLGIGQARILFEVVPQAEQAYHALAVPQPPPSQETP